MLGVYFVSVFEVGGVWVRALALRSRINAPFVRMTHVGLCADQAINQARIKSTTLP